MKQLLLVQLLLPGAAYLSAFKPIIINYKSNEQQLKRKFTQTEVMAFQQSHTYTADTDCHASALLLTSIYIFGIFSGNINYSHCVFMCFFSWVWATNSTINTGPSCLKCFNVPNPDMGKLLIILCCFFLAKKANTAYTAISVLFFLHFTWY